MAAEVLDFAGLDSTVGDVTDQTTDTDNVDTDVTDAADQTDEGDGGTGEEGEGESHRPAGDDRIDGRRGPANMRNAIKAISEAHPEHSASLKELGAAYFREQSFKQHFATPQEAESAKNLIESVGGVDGIATLQERDAMYQAQDAFLRDGDPAVLEDFATDFPEGFAALAPHYLDKLAKVNPEAFSSAIVPYAIGMLQNAGLGQYLHAMSRETDINRIKAYVKDIADWLGAEHGRVQQMRQPQQKNPAQDRLTQQQTELERQREEFFTKQTDDASGALIRPTLDKTVQQYAKKNGWNSEQTNEFRSRLATSISEQMHKDETYTKQLRLRAGSKTRSADAIAKYIAGEFERRMNDKDGAMAVEARVNKLFGKTGKSGKPTTGVVKGGQPKTSPTGGAIRISQEPPRDAINWDHPDADLLYLGNEAWLKNGRHVRW